MRTVTNHDTSMQAITERRQQEQHARLIQGAMNGSISYQRSGEIHDRLMDTLEMEFHQRNGR